jgi:hypothetical protein
MPAWDFIENATVDDIEAVPEEHKSHYVEDKTAGKFVLKPDVVPLAQSLTNSQKALAKLTLTRKEDAKKDATRRTVLDGIKSILPEIGIEVEDDDITKLPEVLKTKVTELVESGKNGKDNKVNIENVRKAKDGEIAKLKDEHKKELGSMEGALFKHIVENVALNAMAKVGTIESAPELLMPKVRENIKVVKTDDGDYVARVVDTDGTWKLNDKGVEMSVEELVGSMKTKFPNMFKSKETGGGGAQQRTQTQQVKTLAKGGEKSSVDKIAGGLDSIKRN